MLVLVLTVHPPSPSKWMVPIPAVATAAGTAGGSRLPTLLTNPQSPLMLRLPYVSLGPSLSASEARAVSATAAAITSVTTTVQIVRVLFIDCSLLSSRCSDATPDERASSFIGRPKGDGDARRAMPDGAHTEWPTNSFPAGQRPGPAS